MPEVAAWRAAIQAFDLSLRRAYPPFFWDSLKALKAGDAAGLDEAIRFLEADPWFFRSGYVKEMVATLVKRFALSEKQAERVRGIVLARIDNGAGREFRRYCRLARRVDSPLFRQVLGERLDANDPHIRRRAAWVLEALSQKPAERARSSP